MVDASPAVNATLFDKLNFDFIRDIALLKDVLRVRGMPEFSHGLGHGLKGSD
jgi:hypothetical protein